MGKICHFLFCRAKTQKKEKKKSPKHLHGQGILFYFFGIFFWKNNFLYFEEEKYKNRLYVIIRIPSFFFKISLFFSCVQI